MDPVITFTSTSERVGVDPAGVVVRAARVGGRTVIRELSGVEPWRPRIVSRTGLVATIALVSTRASLIAGDDVRLSVSVGPGAVLELVEIGATLAHDARSGPPAAIRTSLTVEPGGVLVWCGEPLIAASGCDALRTTEAEVGAGGRLLLGDTIVLGRAGERPGALATRTRIVCDGAPLIDETLDTRDLDTVGSAVVMGGRRLLRSLTLAGILDDDPPADTLRAHGPGMLWRSFEPVGSDPAGVAARWRALVLGDAAGAEGA
jgi:urease accessory protein